MTLSDPVASMINMWPGIQTNDDAGLLKVVDPSTFVRGLGYAQSGAAIDIEWQAGEGIITGRVVDGARKPCSTLAFVRPAGPVRYVFVEGRCDCAVGFDCEHVVALVMTALSDGGPVRGHAPEAVADWKRLLDPLLADGARPDGGGGTVAAEIAVELTLSNRRRAAGRRDDASGTRPRLLARLVRPGRDAGELNWSRLRVRPELVAGPVEQVRWLRLFHLVYEAGRDDGGHRSYDGNDDEPLDLTAFESNQLWPLLDEASRLGVRFVYGKRRSGDVDRYRTARLALDVTRDTSSGDLVIVPTLVVDGVERGVVPVRFVGVQGHGVVYVPRDHPETTTDPRNWRFGLARLERPASPELQRLVLDERRLTVPAAGVAMFREEYVPRLQRLTTVASSDGSFADGEPSSHRIEPDATTVHDDW